jgi:hypothetical protein
VYQLRFGRTTNSWIARLFSTKYSRSTKHKMERQNGIVVLDNMGMDNNSMGRDKKKNCMEGFSSKRYR